MDSARKHVFGAMLLGLAGWETAAYAGRVRTITAFSRERPWTRPVWAAWFLLVLRHLWRP